jgi:hypothetical protein
LPDEEWEQNSVCIPLGFCRSSESFHLTPEPSNHTAESSHPAVDRFNRVAEPFHHTVEHLRRGARSFRQGAELFHRMDEPDELSPSRVRPTFWIEQTGMANPTTSTTSTRSATRRSRNFAKQPAGQPNLTHKDRHRDTRILPVNPAVENPVTNGCRHVGSAGLRSGKRQPGFIPIF